MLPSQILLNNLLYDSSQLAIPTDRVDDADLLAPRRWDTPFVRNFMLCFGPLSSAFDLMAFGLLYWVLHTPAEVFQTAWFVESMATQVFVIFVIRTTRACWRDRPSPWLALASLAAVGVALALPFLPWGRVFGLVPLPAEVLGLLMALTLGYLAVAELAKHAFYRWIGNSRAVPAPDPVL
jgi:Mg2+-importing ATPase